jgi:serine/threonine protein kinase
MTHAKTHNLANVPAINGFLVTAGHALIFMERAAAGSMQDGLFLGRLSERECAYVVACLLAAVEGLRGGGWHHGDIKPANILVAADGEIWLGDFNIACRLNDEGRAFGFGGTPMFMAPEVKALNYGVGYDVRAESYSIGKLLNELVDLAEVGGPSPWSEAGLNAWGRLTLECPAARGTWGSACVQAWLAEFGHGGKGDAGGRLVPPPEFVRKAARRAAEGVGA